MSTLYLQWARRKAASEEEALENQQVQVPLVAAHVCPYYVVNDASRMSCRRLAAAGLLVGNIKCFAKKRQGKTIWKNCAGVILTSTASPYSCLWHSWQLQLGGFRHLLATGVARYGYTTVFQTVAVGRSPSLLNNFSVDTLCKMQA